MCNRIRRTLSKKARKERKFYKEMIVITLTYGPETLTLSIKANINFRNEIFKKCNKLYKINKNTNKKNRNELKILNSKDNLNGNITFPNGNRT
jgi:hypothetical protein